MHPRNFGSHVTLCPPVRPSTPQAHQYKITQSTRRATQVQLKVLFGRKSHSRSCNLQGQNTITKNPSKSLNTVRDIKRTRREVKEVT